MGKVKRREPKLAIQSKNVAKKNSALNIIWRPLSLLDKICVRPILHWCDENVFVLSVILCILQKTEPFFPPPPAPLHTSLIFTFTMTSVRFGQSKPTKCFSNNLLPNFTNFLLHSVARPLGFNFKVFSNFSAFDLTVCVKQKNKYFFFLNLNLHFSPRASAT